MRPVLRKIHALKVIGNETVFSYEQVEAALRKTKSSKALGPDGISPLMLKHIGMEGITYLTMVINRSISIAIIPEI